MEISTEEIESILLSDNRESLDKLIIFLEEDYHTFLNRMLGILYQEILSNHLVEANMIITNIENIIFVDYQENYRLITTILKEFISKLITIKNISPTELKMIKYRLLSIIRNVNIRQKVKKTSSLYTIYHRIIFKERNLSIIEEMLKKEKDVLSRKDNHGNDLFYNILDYYANLKESDTAEIEYFHNVIMLFFKYAENSFVRDSKRYYSILEREESHNKKHVQDILSYICDFSLIDVNRLKKQYDIQVSPSTEVLKEITTFTYDTQNRVRIDAPFVTIDEESATCLDDALSVTANPDGSYNLYIAITDIPSLIPYGSLTFYSALRRIETLYLCDSTINLYPAIIANDICSLLPNADKNAIVYKFHVDENYNVDQDSLEIIKGIIRIQNKLSYDNVNKYYGLTDSERIMLERAYYIAMKLRSQNSQKEDYRRIENFLYSNATYHHSLFTDKSVSANIVQETMLLVNSAHPKYLSERGLISTYRNHQINGDVSLAKVLESLLQNNHLNAGSDEYQNIIKTIKNMYLNAYYSTENKGHEGLGYKYYSHSSSPARRFIDSFNQYLLYFQLFHHLTDRDYYDLEKTAKEIVTHVNNRKLENAEFASEYNYLRYKEKILEKK